MHSLRPKVATFLFGPAHLKMMQRTRYFAGAANLSLSPSRLIPPRVMLD
jgi:hypothetical protein